MLSLQGNTAPYLQYAYTRVRSVFRRAAAEGGSATTSSAPVLDAPEERQLGVQLVRFQEVVEQVAEDGLPLLLCTYLYDLATAFLRFYEACPILTATPDVRASRLALAERTGETLRDGLGLLGIETVERM
jgi:arginyl-tRNA synthetase